MFISQKLNCLGAWVVEAGLWFCALVNVYNNSRRSLLYLSSMGISHSKHKQYYEMRRRVHGYRR